MADEEQEKLLEEAVSVVRQESFQMQRALDESNIKDTLKHASNIICELRTSLLSPKTYYELYMQVFDNLSRLERAFLEEYRKGINIKELYEKVQHAGNILPRLYLLITVGSVYIQTKQESAKDILKDLIEMTKGVQHPVRGLFLRYYLNKMCKDKLPDENSEYAGEAGEVADSVDFLLQNLSEMNRLWIRMQHTGNVRDKNKREKERSDLKVTVGENIVRLSSLEGITIEMYKTIVLPRILEIVTSSKDVIAEQYLMDCIIQAFPDEYHLNTLEPLLEASTELEAAVDAKTIFINLLSRLSDFADEKELEIVREMEILDLIKNYIEKVISESSAGDLRKFLELEVAFLRFSLRCFPEHTENVNMILDTCVAFIKRYIPDGRLDPDSLKSIVNLLSHPLESLSLAILTIPSYPALMKYLHFKPRKQVAFKIVEAVITKNKSLDDLYTATQLLGFLSPLVEDSEDSNELDEYEFEIEEQSIAKLIHLVSAQGEQKLEIFNTFLGVFVKGGPKRMIFTVPSLIFGYIKLLLELKNEETLTEDLLSTILKTILKLILKIAEIKPELALKLNLQALQVMNEVISKGSDFEEIAYEFASSALLIFQDDLTDIQTKKHSIACISAALLTTECFEEDNADTLMANCAEYAAKEQRREEQAIGACIASHLFWNEQIQNAERVADYLKRGVNEAEFCLKNEKDLNTLVYLLNAHLHFHVEGVESIEIENIKKIVDMIRDSLKSAEKNPEMQSFHVEARAYFENTLEYIENRKSDGKLMDLVIED